MSVKSEWTHRREIFREFCNSFIVKNHWKWGAMQVFAQTREETPKDIFQWPRLCFGLNGKPMLELWDFFSSLLLLIRVLKWLASLRMRRVFQKNRVCAGNTSVQDQNNNQFLLIFPHERRWISWTNWIWFADYYMKRNFISWQYNSKTQSLNTTRSPRHYPRYCRE